MKYRWLFVACCTALTVAGCSDDLDITGGTPAIDNTSGPVVVNSAEDALPNMVLVKFREAYGETIESEAAVSRSGVASRSGITDFDRFLDDVQVVSFERLFPKGKFEKRTREAGMHLWYKVRFKSSVPMTEVERELKSIPAIQVVQFNAPVRPIEPTNVIIADNLMNMSRSARAGELEKPNDPEFKNQWNLHFDGDKLFDKYAEVADINFLQAWSRQKKASDVIVAVIDQGVNYSHPDLAANMWKNPGETAQGSSDDKDGNGYAGDLYGYDFAEETGDITIGTHGTHVAGVISALNNNSRGIAGIAGGDGTDNSGARIMTCSIFTESGGGGSAAVAEAVKYAADNGAVICQNSWGYTNPETDWENGMTYSAERQAYDYFIKYAGKNEDNEVTGPMDGGIVVFAAGNYGYMYGDAKMYPAAHPDFIAVSSVGADFNPAYYTEYGDWVDICAPGGDQLFASNEIADSTDYTSEKDMRGGILSTYFEEGNEKAYTYAYLQGTSQACPQVSALAALSIQYAKDKGVTLKAAELKELLFESTRNIDGYFKGTKSDNGRYTGYSFTLNMEDYKGKMGLGLIDAGLLLDNVGARVGAGADHQKPATVTKQELTENVKAGSLTLTWTPKADIELYKLYISSKEIKVDDNGYILPDDYLEGPKMVYSKDAENGKLSCTLDGLRAETTYNVAVVAVDKFRFQSEPAIISYTTAAPSTGNPAKDLEVTGTGAASVTLKWTESGDCVNDTYVSYVITCATDASYSQGIVKKTVLAKEVGKEFTATVTGLKPSTRYYVKIEAWDQFNISSPIGTTEVTTTANTIPTLTPATVDKQNLQYWESKSLSFTINDSDEGDSWTAKLKDPGKCWTLAQDGKKVVLTFEGPVDFSGDSEAVLTVTDSNDGQATVAIPYTVAENKKPSQSKRFKDLYLSRWGVPQTMDLNDYFEDPNNEKLNFSYVLKGHSVELAIGEDGVLNITGAKNGLTEITIEATDAKGEKADAGFQVMVRQSSQAVEIYPNPVSDVMNIRMGEDVTGTVAVKIYTASGNLVYQSEAAIAPFAPAQLNVSMLNAGSYVVEVAYGGQTYKNNIVKL